MSRRLPAWLTKGLAEGNDAHRTEAVIKEWGLSTICREARCPNRNECYAMGTATFLILGEHCTRSCGFCSVRTGRPEAVDATEPERLAEVCRELELKHVVITSVARDELPDEGAGHFAAVIRALRKRNQDLVIEILTPDFKKDQKKALDVILAEPPDIYNHNVESVPRLYKKVRPQAVYEKSLSLLKQVKEHEPALLTKSGLMVGLGERPEELQEVFYDLCQARTDILTISQYLKPDGDCLEVEEYVSPEAFDEYKRQATMAGFLLVESGPFVRSSYHAKDSFDTISRILEERACKKLID